MTYNFEKYKDKREKVLGVKKRGVSFGTLAYIVSLILVLGLSITIIPKSINYFNNQRLDNAIYKLQDSGKWSHEVITDTNGLTGVEKVTGDGNGSRIIVTFDRTITDTKSISAFFTQKELKTILLNRVSHIQRLKTQKKEARFGG